MEKTLIQKDKSITEIPCPICKNHNYNFFYKYQEDLCYVKCTTCSLILQNPQPSIDEIYDIYSDNYFEYEIENQENFFALMKLGLSDINFTKITASLKEPKTILDIGCATGLLLNDFKKNGWQTYGVEICKASAMHAKSEYGLSIKTKPLEKCKFESNFFDVVHLSHLIEHVSNPASLIEEIYRITKKSGYAIITTPNISGLFAKILLANWRSAIKEHLFLFSKKTLRLLLKKKGFKIIKTVSWGSLPIEKSKSKILKKTFDKLVKLLNIGDVTLILAQK